MRYGNDGLWRRRTIVEGSFAHTQGKSPATLIGGKRIEIKVSGAIKYGTVL